MKTIVLEDNIEYAIIKEMTIDNTLYTLFANIDDEEDICFRKTVKKNDEDFYVGLENEEELEKVLMYFSTDILNNIENSED